jgi:hypothetical protein
MKLSIAFFGALALCIFVVASNPSPAPSPLSKAHILSAR